MSSQLMAIGTRAMFANYAALQTTGNNIANANTPGYSRQQVELETAGGQFTGAGFFGKGVNVSTVSRLHDEFLTREAATTRSLSAADSTRSALLNRLEEAFPTGEAGLGYATGQFLNSFVDVANRPQDLSARQVVLSNATELASRFRSAAQQVDALQADVTEELKVSLSAVNVLALRVADLNAQIAGARGTGQEPNDLLDQRDRAIGDLSAHVQVTTLAADDGSMSVFVGGGQRLVLGGTASQLVAVPDMYDLSVMRLAIDDVGGMRVMPDDLITGGSIAGLLRFQRNDLTDARNLLGQMAAAIAGSVNEQQALGLDLLQPAGAGAAIFSVTPPRVLDASLNTGTAAITATVADASQLRASDYQLRYDGTNYSLTQLSGTAAPTTITPAQLAAGHTVNGITLQITAGTPASGDRFLVQPVGAAARNMQRVLDDPRGIAAASPVTATLGPDNTGTATLASLNAVSTTLDPDLTATLTFTSDTGNYDWELRDRLTNALVSSGSAVWQAGQPIALNGWEMQLNGVPRSGDLATVEMTAYPASNNGNARALTDLRDAGLVNGESVTNAYSNAMADIGVRVQGGRNAAQMSAALAASAETTRSAKSGVNLDEEAARLIQYQQSYQAAAKMLQVAQSVFDALLQVTR